MDNAVEFVGNTTRDVELRFTANGTAVGNFGLAVNRQVKVGDDYEEETFFLDVTIWEKLAENVAESIPKGTRVMVLGRMKEDSWQTKEGDQRKKLIVVADEVGPSMRWATATVARNEKGNGRQPQRQPARSAARPSRPAAPSYEDEPF